MFIAATRIFGRSGGQTIYCAIRAQVRHQRRGPVHQLIEHRLDHRLERNEVAQEPAHVVRRRHGHGSLQRIKPAALVQLLEQGRWGRVLEDNSREHRIPHGNNRIGISAVSPPDLELSDNILLWEGSIFERRWPSDGGSSVLDALILLPRLWPILDLLL